MTLEVQENVPLAPLTTLQVGGPARFFVTATTENEVAEAFEYADVKKLDIFVLGGGSNILVSDSGFDGLVIHVKLRGIGGGSASVNERATPSPDRLASGLRPRPVRNGHAVEDRSLNDSERVSAMAGEDWDNFVEHCVANDLAGVECLSGIPGLVGGTPVQNVGAYGQEVSETIVSVRCFDRRTRGFIDLKNEECGFEYRKSIFNSAHRDRYVVLSVNFKLTPGGKSKIVYRDLRQYFGAREPALRETREAVLEIRRAKSMVIDPTDPNSQSAGSFFKNPIVSQKRFDEIASRFGRVPSFPAGDDLVKIPAAWLIERAGFRKGLVHGNAGISSNHTLAIINRGGATAAEIVSLKDAVQAAVESQFRISLQPEPICVGFRSCQ